MSEPQPTMSAVLFDMDGVLIDSRPAIEAAWREGAHLVGRKITQKQLDMYVHGQPGPSTMRALFGDLSEEERIAVHAHVMHVEETSLHVPIPGVQRVLRRLAAAGVAIGVVTSGWREKVANVMQVLDAAPMSVMVTLEDVEQGKPHPAPYILAAERLALPTSRTIVFEDSRSGVASAVAAGAFCIGIGGKELLREGARAVVRDFESVDVLGNTGPGAVLSAGAFRLFVAPASARAGFPW